MFRYGGDDDDDDGGAEANKDDTKWKGFGNTWDMLNASDDSDDMEAHPPPHHACATPATRAGESALVLITCLLPGAGRAVRHVPQRLHSWLWAARRSQGAAPDRAPTPADECLTPIMCRRRTMQGELQMATTHTTMTYSRQCKTTQGHATIAPECMPAASLPPPLVALQSISPPGGNQARLQQRLVEEGRLHSRPWAVGWRRSGVMWRARKCTRTVSPRAPRARFSHRGTTVQRPSGWAGTRVLAGPRELLVGRRGGCSAPSRRG